MILKYYFKGCGCEADKISTERPHGYRICPNHPRVANHCTHILFKCERCGVEEKFQSRFVPENSLYCKECRKLNARELSKKMNRTRSERCKNGTYTPQKDNAWSVLAIKWGLTPQRVSQIYYNAIKKFKLRWKKAHGTTISDNEAAVYIHNLTLAESGMPLLNAHKVMSPHGTEYKRNGRKL